MIRQILERRGLSRGTLVFTIAILPWIIAVVVLVGAWQQSRANHDLLVFIECQFRDHRIRNEDAHSAIYDALIKIARAAHIDVDQLNLPPEGVPPEQLHLPVCPPEAAIQRIPVPPTPTPTGSRTSAQPSAGATSTARSSPRPRPTVRSSSASPTPSPSPSPTPSRSPTPSACVGVVCVQRTGPHTVCISFDRSTRVCVTTPPRYGQAEDPA